MVEFGYLLIEVELLNNIDYILREMIEITAEVVGYVIGIAQQSLKRKG